MRSSTKYESLTGAARCCRDLGMVSSAVASAAGMVPEIANGIYCAEPEAQAAGFLRDEADLRRPRRWFRRQRLASADDGRRHQRGQPLSQCDELDAYRRSGQYPKVDFRRPGPGRQGRQRDRRVPGCRSGDAAGDPRRIQAGQRGVPFRAKSAARKAWTIPSSSAPTSRTTA